jgi:hypothetical protein
MRSTIASVILLVASSYGIFAQADIHKVDFKNFTYSPYCAGEELKKVTVKEGEFYNEKQEDGWVDRFSFNVMSVEYGDLNADGKDEAVILTVCNTGGTGNFTEGFLYTVRNAKPFLVARIPGGDRANGGLHQSSVANGILSIESYDVGEMGGACCPEYIVTTNYKLTAGKLKEFGKAVRKELYPKERVTFARGSSGKTIQVKIPAGEGKRFVLGAAAGQSLRVSVNTDKASLRLLEEAEMTSNTNGFTAKLPKSGDYTVEVQNNADIDLVVMLNIKIM